MLMSLLACMLDEVTNCGGRNRRNSSRRQESGGKLLKKPWFNQNCWATEDGCWVPHVVVPIRLLVRSTQRGRTSAVTLECMNLRTPTKHVLCQWKWNSYGFDVHGSVHHNTNLIEMTNKIQLCRIIYYSIVPWLFNMFRAILSLISRSF